MTHKILLRLEPLVRIVRNIMGVNSWKYQLLVSSGGYFLGLTYADKECWYRISELVDTTETKLFTLPIELIHLLGSVAIKLAAQSFFEIQYEEKHVVLSVENYTETFTGEYKKFSRTPEDLLEDNIGNIPEFDKVLKIINMSSAIKTVHVKDGMVVGVDEEIVCSYMQPIDTPVNVLLNDTKFVYSTLSKMSVEESGFTIYKADMYSTLHATFSVKLTSKERVYGQIFFVYKPVPSLSGFIDVLKPWYDTLLETSAVNITVEKIEQQQRYIEVNQLTPTDLVVFSNDRKIKVKDFLTLLYNHREELTAVHLLDNMVLVRFGIDVLFTIYEKVTNE